MNKGSNYMKHALIIVWCAGILLLGGCSDKEEGTWKQGYENRRAVMGLEKTSDGEVQVTRYTYIYSSSVWERFLDY